MFKNRGLFGGIWKPKNPHSLEHLKYLYSVLYKNQTVTESNKSLLVETLRSIAEILIWGDQNDSTVFDFFLERNMLRYYSNLFVTSKNETTNSPLLSCQLLNSTVYPATYFPMRRGVHSTKIDFSTMYPLRIGRCVGGRQY